MGAPLISLRIPAPDPVEGVFAAGGLPTSLSSANGDVIDGQTLAPGGRISFDATWGLHVGSSLIALPTQVPDGEFIAGGL